jgi:ubiquinone/menaquinone biosynthesis C-methylase UbiE
MRWDTRLLLLLNEVAPRPTLPDRRSPGAYASWQHAEAVGQVAMAEAAGVSLDVPRIVDLGCGPGGKSVYLARRCPGQVLGIDRSREHLREARAFARASGVSTVTFAAGDATRLPLADGSADLVVTTDTFEHFADPRVVLAEAARILRPGGRLVALFAPFGSPLGSHLYDWIRVPWCHLLFSRAALAEGVRELGRRQGRTLPAEEAVRAHTAAEEAMDYFDRELNRMTLRRFRCLVETAPGLLLRSWRSHPPPKLRVLRPLLAVPGLDEYLTGMLVAVVERREPA